MKEIGSKQAVAITAATKALETIGWKNPGYLVRGVTQDGLFELLEVVTFWREGNPRDVIEVNVITAKIGDECRPMSAKVFGRIRHQVWAFDEEGNPIKQ